MAQQRPPTPPQGTDELLYGLREIVHHNASTPYRYDGGDGAYLHSGQQGSCYGSPGPTIHDVYYGGTQYPDLHDPNEVGLGIQYDGYAAPESTYYPNHARSYTASPYLQGLSVASPPTPRSSTNSDGGRRTRSGRPLARENSPKTRVSKSPKPRKAKAGKGDKPKTPKLTAPLSVLTKDYTNIPVRNMEEWVNRPAEVRRAEVEKRNGYITRPMNSFMLYRSAYAERTKMWCLQNNHQIVSSVSGESWPMEPPEVREMYNEFAKIERINHQNAHPTYKFSPSKASSSGRKRKGAYSDDDDDDEPSDLDDPDAEWGVNHRKSRVRQSKRSGKEAGYPVNSSLQGHLYGQRFGPDVGINKSSWEASNEGKPLPAAIGHADLYQHQYYQTTVHPSLSIPGIEDIRMTKMEAPGMQYGSGQSLLGLPGQHHELLQAHSQSSTPMPQEPQVDPMLLAYDSSRFEHPNGFSSMGHDMKFDDAYGMHEQYRPNVWQTDPTLGPLEAGSEFDKWMDEPSAN